MARFFSAKEVKDFFLNRGYNENCFSFNVEDVGDAIFIKVDEKDEGGVSASYLFFDYLVEREEKYQVYSKCEYFSKQWVRFLASNNGSVYKDAFVENAAKEAAERAKAVFEED